MAPYPDPTSRSAELFDRSRKVLPGGNTRTTVYHAPYPIFARSGSGCRVTDVDGVERVDFINNYTSLIHGHSHPEITAALSEQLRLGTCFANPTEAEVALAEVLCARVSSFDRVRFCNSGTEAVMNAVKAARAYTDRPMIAKVEGSYHGAYDPLEVSLDPSPANWGEDVPARIPYARGTPQGVLDDVVVLPYNDAAAAERLIGAHADRLAAVVLDLVPNRLGLIPAQPAFVETLRRLTRAHGIVLIVDEVITFRLDEGGAQHLYGVEPELTTLGKIIGGGLPVGAVAGKAEVMAVFDGSQGRAPLPHGGTFNANPLTMVAGRKAMELLTPEAFAHINALGDQARTELRRAFAVAGVPGQVMGQGSLFTIHFKERAPTNYREQYKTPAEARLMSHVFQHLLNAGVVIGSGGMGAVSTPMTGAEIDQLAEALLGALRGIPQAAAVVA